MPSTQVLVTVGSTRFDSLVQTIVSAPVLEALHGKGYRKIVLQYGNSTLNFGKAVDAGVQAGVTIELVKFKPSLQPEFEAADLVISHAGSGTILDVLRQNKSLVVVPNSTLLHNHQQELASALAEQGYLVASTVDHLARDIDSLDASKLVPFPPFDPSRFRTVIDEEMGL